MNIYVENAVMNLKCWSLEMMNLHARHAVQKNRQKRCHHSDFLSALNIRHHQKAQDRPVQVAVPQTARVAVDKQSI